VDDIDHVIDLIVVATLSKKSSTPSYIDNFVISQTISPIFSLPLSAVIKLSFTIPPHQKRVATLPPH